MSEIKNIYIETFRGIKNLRLEKEKKLFYYPFDDKNLMVPFSSYRWGGWHKR